MNKIQLLTNNKIIKNERGNFNEKVIIYKRKF